MCKLGLTMLAILDGMAFRKYSEVPSKAILLENLLRTVLKGGKHKEKDKSQKAKKACPQFCHKVVQLYYMLANIAICSGRDALTCAK